MADKSVDLVLTDPPYNIGIAEWDKIKNYTEWMGDIFLECQRVLKDNGQLYWWHNDMSQMPQIMEWLRLNTRFIFNSFIIWDKGDFRALSWKNPSEESELRSWFNTCEYCLAYTFQDSTGLSFIDKEYVAPRNPFAIELKRARIKKGVSINEVAEYGKFYGNVNHGGAVTNWENGYNVPLKEQWKKLCEYLPIERQEYEELRQEYEELRYKHKPAHNHNNLWRSKLTNNGKLHPTEKPIDLMQRIIITTTDENDTILDPFMGSGTTGVACKMLNRNFIGIEISPKYYAIAKTRIEKQTEPMDLKF